MLDFHLPLDFSSLAVYRETYNPDLGFAVVQDQGCANTGVSVYNEGSIPTAHIYPCSVPASNIEGQLAPLHPAATVHSTSSPDQSPSKSGEHHVKPSPSHFWMCGYALLMGALEATVSERAADQEWVDSFRAKSREAASSVAPLSRYLLDKHVFPEDRS